MIRRWFLIFPLLFIATVASAAHDAPPESVEIVGTFQDEIGCAGDWIEECETTSLAFDETHQLWIGVIDIPAGEYEYKAILNGTYDLPVGEAGAVEWPNILLNLEADTTVTFIYNDATHYLADNINTIFANVPGSFNAEIGCPCLLYTSPSPRDGLLSRMPSSA